MITHDKENSRGQIYATLICAMNSTSLTLLQFAGDLRCYALFKFLMNTRDMIGTYSAHGGAWTHLKKSLIREGLSEAFAEYFISRCRYRLGEETAEKALRAYDYWIESQCEKQTKLFMALLTL